jgi:hypothetical protein
MTKFAFVVFHLLFGLTSLFGQPAQELILDFSEIDSVQYMEYKKDYSNMLILDSTKRTIPDSSFTLVVHNKRQQFDCQPDYNPCHYYKGFLSPIQSYVITYCTLHECGTYLIDQHSGERKELFSPFDNECEPPLLSKKHNKMLVFASSIFETESFISIYQSNDDNGSFNFESFDSFTTDMWEIYKAICIDETSFALRIRQEYIETAGGAPRKLNFIKAEIK